MAVLVTGGAGYIGSHMTWALADRRDEVVILDNLSTGVRAQAAPGAAFVEGDIADRELVGRVLREHAVDAVVHFAGSIVVPESVQRPLHYYANNTVASRGLIECCVAQGVKNFIFSSTASVYGTPQSALVSEDTPTNPESPYGRSKLMTEWMLRDVARAHDFRFMVLRYFNVAGADPQGRTGQSNPDATHLIKRACLTALGQLPHMDIFGTDYDTPDGTGVRDYIHVSDLIEAHLLALDALRAGGASQTYNCGYGRGASVREVIAMTEKVAGRDLAVRVGPRRSGDVAALIASSARLARDLGWKPRHDTLEEIVSSAYLWEKRRLSKA